MALDHALAACLGEREAVLRLYGWSRPTVSFGRSEPARALYGDGAHPNALDFVRRSTGGRAVVHARELTYAVVAPLRAWGGLRAAYVAINEALGTALRSLGAPVELSAAREGGRALRPDAGPCFRSPAPGEVTAAGRKLVGSAQARLEGALLQHGSILLDDDQGLLAGGGADRPATVRALLGDVSIDDLADVVAMSLRETFGGTWEEGGWRASEIRAADRLETERYALDSWTWRR
jgi:lipoyl(octanoyl) transferase